MTYAPVLRSPPPRPGGDNVARAVYDVRRTLTGHDAVWLVTVGLRPGCIPLPEVLVATRGRSFPPGLPPSYLGVPIRVVAAEPRTLRSQLPGNYRLADAESFGASPDGLGKVFSMSLNTPWGSKKFSADVPYEQVATSAVNYAVSQLQPHIPKLLDQALKQAGGYVTGTLWPQLQPKVRAEVDRAIAEARVVAEDAVDEATARAAVIASGLMVVIVGSAWWIRKKGSP